MDPIPKKTQKNTRTQSIDNLNCLKIIKEIEFIIIILPKREISRLTFPGEIYQAFKEE